MFRACSPNLKVAHNIRQFSCEEILQKVWKKSIFQCKSLFLMSTYEEVEVPDDVFEIIVHPPNDANISKAAFSKTSTGTVAKCQPEAQGPYQMQLTRSSEEKEILLKYYYPSWPPPEFKFGDFVLADFSRQSTHQNEHPYRRRSRKTFRGMSRTFTGLLGARRWGSRRWSCTTRPTLFTWEILLWDPVEREHKGQPILRLPRRKPTRRSSSYDRHQVQWLSWHH